jgi:hypothetical protein
MDPEVEARFARSEASFNLRMDRAEERAKMADERMDKAERRMELADKREAAHWKKTQERWKRDDERWDKVDKRLESTRKLVEAGMKIVVRMNSRLDALTRTVEEISKSQKLVLKLLQGGRNGHGSH